uniref:Bardet-Biedl syndrome 2 protein homolog n=1 Tax=Globisporangium ultimum (strain ATCC 200006 / CBS 805.95 / DAOM BR144) TaxID=431595 RepID=K3WPT3_GLOUD
MLPAFQLHLHQPVLERVAQVGKFDGKHPSLACGTTAGKVFLHSPNEKHDGNLEDSEQNVRFLKINRKISALSTGKFLESDPGDTLVVGTQASLLAYNVEKNSDIFYKDIPDGVNTMLFVPVPAMKTGNAAPSQMVVVGGNCSLQGYNNEGNELFWTVTGDNVRAMTMTDVTGHGRAELVVGSDDFEIRAFQNEEIVYECTETSQILALTPIQKQMFGYALQNGTVGVYKGKYRAWRVKSKNTPTAIQAFDINGDGEKEIVIGWSNGKFESRKITNGEVVHKDMFTSPIAALVTADYRMDGNEEIICCSADGEIRGYFMAAGEFPTTAAVNERALNEEKEVAKLSKYKAGLQLELKSLEAITLGSSSANKNAKTTGLRIKAGTKIHIKSTATKASPSFELEVSTENESVIKMITIYEYDVGIFEGESLVIRPPSMVSAVTIPLQLTKYVPAKMDFKVLVGSRGNNTSFHVFEAVYKLPKFAMFLHLPSAPESEPRGNVRFKTPVKTQLMCSWIEQSFTLNAPCPDNSTIDLYFKSFKDGSPLCIFFTPTETVIRTDDMDLAAELVQDMCTHLEWCELESTADFPRQMDDLKHLLVRVDECNSIRLKLTGEMADDSNQVKNLIIRAEDARILNDMSRMRRYYSELFTLNNQLLGEYTKRSTNHQALLDALKEVNSMIQLAARLRFGNAKQTVVAACRKAIKNNNIHALFYIVKTGKEEHQ